MFDGFADHILERSNALHRLFRHRFQTGPRQYVVQWLGKSRFDRSIAVARQRLHAAQHVKRKHFRRHFLAIIQHHDRADHVLQLPHISRPGMR